jgi:hypothetical protein
MNLFLAGFILQVVTAFPCLFTLGTMHPTHYRAFATSSFFFFVGSFIWIIVLAVYRFNHTGSVISGDYLEKEDGVDTLGYMTSSGNFLKIYLIIIFSLWGCLCCFGTYIDLANRGMINCHLEKEYR